MPESGSMEEKQVRILAVIEPGGCRVDASSRLSRARARAGQGCRTGGVAAQRG